MTDSRTYGGYFPLELPPPGKAWYPQAKQYRSARSALFHLLTTVRPQRLWMPQLICQSVIDAVQSAGISIAWYTIDERYYPQLPSRLAADDYLLYVDYLGQCADVKEKLIATLSADRIIFDHSQAFFARPLPVLATIYSPRKFFGVADGGLLETTVVMPQPDAQDRETLHRSAHLLLQHEFDTRSGYAAFSQAESSLEEISASRMSALTERILLSVDYASVKRIRERNYHLLHQRLGDLNAFSFPPHSVSGPFCYPFYFPAQNLHAPLIEQGVFVATYWQDALPRVAPDSAEIGFIHHMIPLPCDQRYSEDDMNRVSDIVRAVVMANSRRDEN
ncbi:hypothetical protein [Enterobacter sp.]|uniref:hypothetical protein n=1 Tax=Enterobacter sp. TaxID=42895 RepID=UPI00296F9B81|nr:hypothetical protein [Enterobacter sp.]